ncbi:MAG: nucleotidyltransferase domain-containing protein [Acidimicrobiia bacterium]|nr:nucleotidyltransferase domain-containing protein [Acidimicrobiia bacterium]
MNSAAPSVAAARLAADELAAAGAGQVLLFGSVARGEGRPHSDIDLVAIFDDLDYSRRWNLRYELTRRAGAACGHSVDVHVTDRPEWARRVDQVSASFEARIAPDAMALIDRPAKSVNWHKEIGLPDTNDKEAEQRLDDARRELNRLRDCLQPTDWEARAAETGETAEHEQHQRDRLIDVCAKAAMAIEHSVKALTALDGRPVRHLHNIAELLGGLPERKPAVDRALASLTHEDVSMWRQAGTYAADRPKLTLAETADLARRLAAAACSVAEIAVAEFKARRVAASHAATAGAILAAVQDHLNTTDLLSGAARRW